MPKSSSSCTWKALPQYITAELLAHATSHRLNSGDTLFVSGDRTNGCYLLDQGVLKVYLASPQGEECILAVLAAGSVVGDLDMVDGLPRSESVLALTPCELRCISLASFQDCGQRHPDIYRYFMMLLAERFRESQSTIAAFAFLTAKGRLAHALLKIAESLGERSGAKEILIPQMINQKELAALAGVARENANRILKDWEQRKLLSKSSQYYRINDKARLEREIEE